MSTNRDPDLDTRLAEAGIVEGTYDDELVEITTLDAMTDTEEDDDGEA